MPGETHVAEHMHARFIEAIKRKAHAVPYHPLTYSVNAYTAAEVMGYQAWPSHDMMGDAVHYELTAMDVKKMKAAACKKRCAAR